MTVNQEKLLKLIQALPESDCLAAIQFVEFLADKAAKSKFTDSDNAESENLFVAEIQKPLDIVRPESESVVAAIKRLSSTYPMLDKATLLDQASNYMSQHILQGRSSVDVIDDLENLFKKHYVKFVRDRDQKGQASK